VVINLVWLLAIVVTVRLFKRSKAGITAPQHRPLWMGPDLIETSELVREKVLTLLQQAGHRNIERHPASDELAGHHSHAMAERNFCSSTDPEGEGPTERLQRLHPRMVMTVLEWNHSMDSLHAENPQHLADLLLGGPDANAQELSELISSQTCNLLGVGISGSASRAWVCIVLGHHWATMTSDRPQIEREGTRPVAAELVAGTRREQLSAALLPEANLTLSAVPAEPFSHDEWSDDRICVYPSEIEETATARIQWYRDGIEAIPVLLP